MVIIKIKIKWNLLLRQSQLNWNVIVRNVATNSNNNKIFYLTPGFNLNKRRNYVTTVYDRDIGTNNHSISASNTLLDTVDDSNYKSIEENNTDTSDKESEFTKWIRESVLENEPSLRVSLRDDLKSIAMSNQLSVEQNSVDNDSSDIYGIPSVDDITFEIIWKDRFSEIGFNDDNEKVVNVVIKRLNYKRNIFKVSQLVLLISALFNSNRFYHIHEIYMAYRKYLYPISSKLIDDTNKYRVLLKRFIQVENQLEHYSEVEQLFAQYIKLNDMTSPIVTIGLKSFVSRDNLQLAKEFFIQIMKDNDNIFPLDSKDFKRFLKFLQNSYQYESIDYFVSMWIQYDKMLDFELLAYIHYIYLINNNPMTDNLAKFVSKEGRPFKSGYFQSVQCKIITFYCQSIRNNCIDHAKLEQLNKEVDRLPSCDSKIKYWYYKNLLKLYVHFHDLKSVQNVLRVMLMDQTIIVDANIYNIIATYFVQRGDLKNLILFYNNLLHDRVINLKSDIFYLILRCSKIAYPDENFQLIINQLKKIIRKSRDDMKLLWWLYNVEKNLKSYDGLNRVDVSDNNFYMKFINKVKRNDLVDAKDLLHQYFQKGTKQDQHILYKILKFCLSSDKSIQLAEIVDRHIRQDDYFYRRNPLKLEIIWLRYHIKMGQLNGSDADSRIRLQQFEKNFDLQLKSQNCLDLANLMIKFKDYTNAERLLKKSKERIINNDKLQWTIYYMMSLKLSTRTLNPQLFIDLLKEWNKSSLPVVLLSKNKNQINCYIKYFYKNWDRINQITSVIDHSNSDNKKGETQENCDRTDINGHNNSYKTFQDWQDSVGDIVEQLKSRDKERRLQTRQDIEMMLDSIQQWIDQAVLENHSYKSSK